MDTLNFTPTHKKGQHLTREEGYYISINKEVKSVTVYLYNGKVKRYKPDIAEQFSPYVTYTEKIVQLFVSKVLT